MAEELHRALEGLGLLESEAQAYLILVRNGAMPASAIASALGGARSSVYPILNALVEKGLADAGAGYASRFSAVPPEQAIPFLIAREREALAKREQLAKGLVERLSGLAERSETGVEEFIQVIRSPRAVGERFERLELEAERSLEVFVKAPVLNRSGNPVQEKILRRGVVIRSLYERAILEVPEIKPYLANWISQGEEARVYEGDLPHKLAIFDRQTVLVHLTMPGDQMRTLFIRHAELAMSLGMLFDSLWEKSGPWSVSTAKMASSPTPGQSRPASEPARSEPSKDSPRANSRASGKGRSQLSSSKQQAASKKGKNK